MLPAVPEAVPRVCSHLMHVSYPSSPPYSKLLLLQSVSSADNAHACDCEWVQPDSSSWDERKKARARQLLAKNRCAEHGNVSLV